MPHSKRLTRRLGGWDVFSVSTGAMISSGLFVLPGLIYARVGPAVVVAYLIAGLFALPALLSKVELTTAMPKAGGTYFFIERSMGSVAGTIGGLATWLSISLKSAFALVGIGEFAVLLYPQLTPLDVKLIAAGLCVVFTCINLMSVKQTGRTQILLVAALVAILVVYIARGLPTLETTRFRTLLATDKHSILMAAGLVFISFGGLTKAASVAEEVRNPKRNLPLGMIGAFVVTLALYVGAVAVTVGHVAGPELARSLSPLTLGGDAVLGSHGRYLMAVAAILAFVSTANAGILSASRFPVAMARDQLVPEHLARVSRRFGTPWVSILLTGGLMAVVVLTLNLEQLVKAASALKLLLFLFVLLSQIVMRESRILNYRPSFVAPLYPWLPVAGVFGYGFLLLEMGGAAMAAIAATVVVGVLWHRFYVHGKAIRRAAVIHVMERAVAREISGPSLGEELAAILDERDGTPARPAHSQPPDCEVLDLGEPQSREAFYRLVSQHLAARTRRPAAQLRKRLLTLEASGSSIVRPGLAIPHVVVGDDADVHLLAVRCEAGIALDEEQPPVYAAFVLAGPPARNRKHLRALSAISELTQRDNFDRDWLRAHSVDELRELLRCGDAGPDD